MNTGENIRTGADKHKGGRQKATQPTLEEELERKLTIRQEMRQHER